MNKYRKFTKAICGKCGDDTCCPLSEYSEGCTCLDLELTDQEITEQEIPVKLSTKTVINDMMLPDVLKDILEGK